MTAWSSHPFPVARAADLRRWIDSGEYGRILAGSYPRRSDDATASPTEEMKAAAESYREEFQTSPDPLVSLLRRLGDGASGLGEWVGTGAGRARDWMNTAANSAADAARATGKDRRSEPPNGNGG
jgi:hypothetical protein